MHRRRAAKRRRKHGTQGGARRAAIDAAKKEWKARAIPSTAAERKAVEEEDEAARAPGKLRFADLPQPLQGLMQPAFKYGSALHYRRGEKLGGGKGGSVYAVMRPENPSKHLRVDTAWGRLPQVVKVFDDVHEDGQWVVVEEGTGAIVQTFDWQHEAAAWCEDNKGRVEAVPAFVRAHGGAGKWSTVPFVNEVAVHAAVSAFALKHTPHVTLATGAKIAHGDGYLFMERVAGTFEKFLSCPKNTDGVVSMRAAAGLVFQVLHTLALLQRGLGFFHHDMHTTNVFVADVRDSDATFGGRPLREVTHFRYETPSGNRYVVPNCGYIVKYGDFGFSSADFGGRRLTRVDMDLFNDKVRTWGAWRDAVEGRRGYDMQVFWAMPPFHPRSRLGGKSQMKRLMRRIQCAVAGGDGSGSSAPEFAKSLTLHHRPAAGKESDVPPEDVIARVFGLNPEPWFDFRAHRVDLPPDAVVCDVTFPREETLKRGEHN